SRASRAGRIQVHRANRRERPGTYVRDALMGPLWRPADRSGVSHHRTLMRELMPRKSLQLGIAAMLLGAGALKGGEGEPGSSTAVFPYAVTKTILDNGLTVLSVPYDSPGIVAYFTIVRTGSRNEVEKGLSGFAHFFEHMMFRGTPAYPEEKYNDVLRSLGADSNAFTNDDWTCYHMTIPASALATAAQTDSARLPIRK